MMQSMLAVLSAMLILSSLATAQTSISCNPTNETCSADVGLSSTTFTTDFTKGENTSWTVADYTTLTYSDSGAAFTINSASDAPTISTDFYIFFGYVEVKMRAAPGTGIISSAVLISDDLDEIDWEFLGGTTDSVQTNFYGKGNTTTYDREYTAPVSGSTTATSHTYALNWTSTSLTWSIDNTVVRTVLYTDAVALNGKNYPQTPCRVRLGSWAGGASSSPGTVTWAGGKTDFNQAPFTMYVESVTIINYNPGSEYSYSDKTGDFSSIKVSNSSSAGSDSSSETSTVSSSASSSSSRSSSTLTAKTSSGGSGNSDAVGSTATATTTATTSSSSSSTAATTTFVQSSSDAGRSSDVSVLDLISGNKVACLVLGAVGLFLA